MSIIKRGVLRGAWVLADISLRFMRILGVYTVASVVAEYLFGLSPVANSHPFNFEKYQGLMVIMVHSSASSQGSLLDWGDLRLIINKSENLCRRLTIGTKSGNYQQVGNLLKAINKRSEISRRQLSGYRSPLRRQWSLTCLSVSGNGSLPIDNWSHLPHLIVDLENDVDPNSMRDNCKI